MSLQVWLPLTGNLNNQGVAKTTVTNSGATISNAGKFGQCYLFNSTPIYTANEFVGSFSTEATVTCWVKLSTSHSGYAQVAVLGTVGTSWNDIKFGIDINGSGVPIGNVSNGSSSIQCSADVAIKDNTWHFVAYTYKTGETKIYIDGALKKTTAVSIVPAWTSCTRFTVGGNSSEVLNHSDLMTDTRLYNNCLSTAEIKDLAKGLVAHYSLTDCMPYTNLAKNSTYVIYNNYGVSASLTKLSEQFGKCDVYRLTMTPTDGSLISFRAWLANQGVYNFYRTFAASTKYCFWIYYRPVTHFDIRVGGTASNINGWTEIEPKYYGGGWYRVGQYRDGSVTSAKTDNIFTSFYTPTAAVGVPISIDFCCPHLVEGYDYILEDGDYQQTTLNYNISDSSGYKYTGSTSSSVAPIAVETSPRSNRSLYFNSTSKNLTLNASFLPTFTTGSVSFWAKVNAKGSSGILPFTGQTTSYYLMASENWTGGFYNGGVSAAGTITYYVDGVVDNTPSGVDGIWHHYCVTGVNMSAWTALKLNNYAASWNGASIYYSDIRFYNTVLSAADVADLANAPIKIASDGALITNGEVVE